MGILEMNILISIISFVLSLIAGVMLILKINAEKITNKHVKTERRTK